MIKLSSYKPIISQEVFKNTLILNAELCTMSDESLISQRGSFGTDSALAESKNNYKLKSLNIS